MLPSNDRVLWWAAAAIVLIGVVVTVARNSSWALEVRSLREFRFLQIDGFIAPIVLLAGIPAAGLAGAVAKDFGPYEKAYVETFVGIVAVSFSLGFVISAFRQTSAAGKICAALTVFVIIGALMLPAAMIFRSH